MLLQDFTVDIQQAHLSSNGQAFGKCLINFIHSPEFSFMLKVFSEQETSGMLTQLMAVDGNAFKAMLRNAIAQNFPSNIQGQMMELFGVSTAPTQQHRNTRAIVEQLISISVISSCDALRLTHVLCSTARAHSNAMLDLVYRSNDIPMPQHLIEPNETGGSVSVLNYFWNKTFAQPLPSRQELNTKIDVHLRDLEDIDAKYYAKLLRFYDTNKKCIFWVGGAIGTAAICSGIAYLQLHTHDTPNP